MQVIRSEFLKIRITAYVSVGLLTLFAVVILTLIQAIVGAVPLFFNYFALGYHVATFYMEFIVVFVVGILASSIIVSEFSSRTIGITVSSSGRRNFIMTAKMVAIFCVTAVTPLIAWIQIAVVLFLVSLTPAIDNTSTTQISWYTALSGSLVQLLRTFPMIAVYVTFATLIAVLFKSRILIIVVMFLVVIIDLSAFAILATVGLNDYLVLLPNGWINIMLGDTARSAPPFNITGLENTLSLSLQQIYFFLLAFGIAITFYLATLFVFAKRDINES